MVRQTIKFRKQLYEEYGSSILNIVNGQAMFECFQEQPVPGEIVPFNEAMCTYKTSKVIFSDEFNKIRAAGHYVSLQEYETTVLFPLQPLFEGEYDCIALWFGDDMFCQINLLTLLAYLDQVRYKGRVMFMKVDERTYDVEAMEMKAAGYSKIYEEVLIQRKCPNVKLLPVMKEGICLYLNYMKEENEITAFIKRHLDKELDVLLSLLLERFFYYGLGDVQYVRLIEKISGRKGL